MKPPSLVEFDLLNQKLDSKFDLLSVSSLKLIFQVKQTQLQAHQTVENLALPSPRTDSFDKRGARSLAPVWQTHKFQSCSH